MVKFINILTLIRVFLAFFIFIGIVYGYYSLALFLFIFAGVSDYFDGHLARKFNATSEIGEILDPFADKILIVFTIIALAINLSSYVIGFIGSIIISREIWVSVLRDFNSRNNNTNATKVTFIAKVKTSSQLFSLFIYLLGLSTDVMLLIVLGDVFLVLALLTTVFSGFEYTINSFKKNT